MTRNSDLDRDESREARDRRLRNMGGVVLPGAVLPDVTGMADQLEALQNAVAGMGDYTQPTNPLLMVYAEYTTVAGQTIATATNTVVNFGTAVMDTHNAVTVGAAWTFRAPMTKTYTMACGLCYTATTAWGAGEWASLAVFVDGVFAVTLDLFWCDTTGVSQMVQLHGCIPMFLKAGSTVGIQTQQRTGGDLALSTIAGYNFFRIMG